MWNIRVPGHVTHVAPFLEENEEDSLPAINSRSSLQQRAERYRRQSPTTSEEDTKKKNNAPRNLVLIGTSSGRLEWVGPGGDRLRPSVQLPGGVHWLGMGAVDAHTLWNIAALTTGKLFVWSAWFSTSHRVAVKKVEQLSLTDEIRSLCQEEGMSQWYVKDATAAAPRDPESSDWDIRVTLAGWSADQSRRAVRHLSWDATVGVWVYMTSTPSSSSSGRPVTARDGSASGPTTTTGTTTAIASSTWPQSLPTDLLSHMTDGDMSLLQASQVARSWLDRQRVSGGLSQRARALRTMELLRQAEESLLAAEDEAAKESRESGSSASEADVTLWTLVLANVIGQAADSHRARRLLQLLESQPELQRQVAQELGSHLRDVANEFVEGL